jgi:5-formyltetrahydrofolate cyclo-ligase
MARRKPRVSASSPELKSWLRKLAIIRRQSLGATLQKKHSQRIIKNLINTPEYKRAKTVAAFIGFASEVLTDGLIEKCWASKKNVLIPMTTKGFDKPFFVLFKRGDKLARTKHGPLEAVTKSNAFNFRSIDLVLVPGLAYDSDGYRLGYGGGVYDRLLKKTPRAAHVGLFFSAQKLHRVPREPHDHPLKRIVTEQH